MKKRILLDSNVWRYFIDADELPQLLAAVRKSRHIVVMSPAVMYEAAKTGDAAMRKKLLSAMSLPLWKRLMPEAFHEAAEIRAEVHRVRPEWLKPRPNWALFNRVRYDWMRAKGGTWDRVRAQPEVLKACEPGIDKLARERAYERRRESKLSPKWHTLPLTEAWVAPLALAPGWKGVPVEAWRIGAQDAFIHSFSREQHPYRDWLDGNVDLEMMRFQAESLGKFWLHDVETLSMPRHWLRWAFEFLQEQYAVSDGTPVDAQIGTYLVDADIFLSADKAMVRIAQKCRKDAPFPMAESLRVPGGSACVDAVIEQLAT